jgi:hypothetical protein
MPGNTITISEGLSWKKTLETRHGELVGLRNQNSFSERRMYGANADKERIITPTYDVKALDRLISGLAREIRLLDQAVKKANLSTELDYLQDDVVLGELQAPSA